MNWKALFKREKTKPAANGSTHVLPLALVERIEALKPGESFSIRAHASGRLYTILAQEDFEYVLERAGMRTVDLDSDSSS